MVVFVDTGTVVLFYQIIQVFAQPDGKRKGSAVLTVI